MSTFDKELQTYAEKLPELQKDSGRYVLIHNGNVEGIFDTYADALKMGYEKFKLERFLVKQIEATEKVMSFTRDLAVCQ